MNKEINTHSFSLSGISKLAKGMIEIRNKEINELREVVESVTKENIRLKDELKIRLDSP